MRKRYEKMSNKELFEYYNSTCEFCSAFDLCNNHNYLECIDGKNSYISQDIEVQPRWALIHSDADLYRIFDEFKNETTLPFSEFPDYLAGVIEV